MSWEFERVAGPYEFTEGPVWDGSGVLFTDIPNDRIVRYDVETGEPEEYRTGSGGHANGLALDDEGRLYGCEMAGRRVARYDDGGSTTVADRYGGDRLNSPNDLTFDSDGNVWFTDPYYGGDWEDDDKVLDLDHRSVYRVDPDAGPESIVRMTDDTTNPNGLALSPGEDTLYVAQSEYGEGNPRELRAYPVEGDTTGEYEVLHDFYPHRGIDGMCLDADGNLVATAGWEESGPGGMVYVFEPGGRVLDTHPVPMDRPTNCAFGDDDLRSLYLTGSDGCLHRARTDRTGSLGPP